LASWSRRLTAPRPKLSSRALAVQSAYQLKRARGWSYVSMSARRVKGDPFWKAVRPNGVPADAQLKPDLVTSAATSPRRSSSAGAEGERRWLRLLGWASPRLALSVSVWAF